MSGVKSIKRKFQRQLIRTFILLVLAAVLSTLLVFIFEINSNPAIKTPFDALWLIIITVSGVGYGDVYPLTVAGKLTIFFSVGTTFILTAALVSETSSMFSEIFLDQRSRQTEQKMLRHLYQLKKQQAELLKLVQDQHKNTSQVVRRSKSKSKSKAIIRKKKS